MSTNKHIQRLWDLGHFNNPAHPTGVKESDLDKLKSDDDVVKIAIQSYQEFMAPDFDRFSLQYHNRIGIADGEVGPATYDLLEMDRCGCPDYDIIANGSGSWPVGCHPDWPNNHAFVIKFVMSTMPSYLKNVFEPAMKLVIQAYADIGIVFVVDNNASRPHTVASWTRGSGWIGLAIVPQGPRCNDSIWAKYDNRYSPSALLDQWARLFAHEFGHNMGMSHSRGGIMNPSITSGPFTPKAWRGDPSEAQLVRWFGGKPVDIGPTPPDPPKPPDPPEPPVPPIPPGPGFWFKGDFELMKGDQPLGKYNLVPKIEV